MLGSSSRLSSVLLNGRWRRREKEEEREGKSEGDRGRPARGKERDRKRGEDQVEDSRQPGLTSGCSGSDWTGFARIP